MRLKNTLLAFAASFTLAVASNAGTNICPNNNFAWGENIGWTNWGDANAGADGVRVYPNFMTGFVWGENVGWINMGNCNGPYANTDNTDFGVNINPDGTLDGFAWGENIGWINFSTEATSPGQGAHYDVSTGLFSGYAWGENVGWINLGDINHRPAARVSDANGDGFTDVNDISYVLFRLGNSGCPEGDTNGDDVVDVNDISFVLFRLGQNCP